MLAVQGEGYGRLFIPRLGILCSRLGNICFPGRKQIVRFLWAFCRDKENEFSTFHQIGMLQTGTIQDLAIQHDLFEMCTFALYHAVKHSAIRELQRPFWYQWCM